MSETTKNVHGNVEPISTGPDHYFDDDDDDEKVVTHSDLGRRFFLATNENYPSTSPPGSPGSKSNDTLPTIECTEYDDLDSLCGSLTYSVESWILGNNNSNESVTSSNPQSDCGSLVYSLDSRNLGNLHSDDDITEGYLADADAEFEDDENITDLNRSCSLSSLCHDFEQGTHNHNHNCSMSSSSPYHDCEQGEDNQHDDHSCWPNHPCFFPRSWVDFILSREGRELESGPICFRGPQLMQ